MLDLRYKYLSLFLTNETLQLLHFIIFEIFILVIPKQQALAKRRKLLKLFEVITRFYDLKSFRRFQCTFSDINTRVSIVGYCFRMHFSIEMLGELYR